MSHDADVTCRCVAEHRPPVLEYERHHILPLYLGSSPTSETVWICPSGHASTHELLRAMLKAGRTLTDHELQQLEPRSVSRYAADLAREGYRRFTAATR